LATPYKDWSKDAQDAVSNLTPESKSGFPGLGSDTLGSVARDADGSITYTGGYTTAFEAFNPSGKYIGANMSFGGIISDDWREFYSQRDPVGKWWISSIADDLWDNWFKIVDIEKPDDDDLDKKVQKILKLLKAKIQLPRETKFERRYGTAIFLLSYTGFGGETDWKTPLFTLNPDGTFPKTDSTLLQISPYPWTRVNVTKVETDDSNIRFGLPTIYTITRGSAGKIHPSISCLLYTSPSPRDATLSRMPSSA